MSIRALSTISPMLRIVGVLILVYAALVAFIYFRQRSMLFFPSHAAPSTQLTPWSDGAHTIGYCREVPHPRTAWLMMHGNAGQAANRDYVLQRMSEKDSLYVLEYPGYGSREGNPCKKSINQAASEAYRLLRSRNPGLPVCVLGESIGSGPACALAAEQVAPDKIILVVPFDSLANAASGHFPLIPVRFLVKDAWDNVKALKNYKGPVEIYGAINDTIIPIGRARALANQVPQARFVTIMGGHNDWSADDQVKIER